MCTKCYIFLLLFHAISIHLQPYRSRSVSNTKVTLFNQYTETNSNQAPIYQSHISYNFKFIYSNCIHNFFSIYLFLFNDSFI